MLNGYTYFITVIESGEILALSECSKNTHIILHQDRGFLILSFLGTEPFDVLEL